MVGRSNEISRENCRAQDADGGPLPTAAGDTARSMAQALRPSIAGRKGNEPGDSDNHRMMRPASSQSSHSSDEAVQQNAVERRGIGREMRDGQSVEQAPVTSAACGYADRRDSEHPLGSSCGLDTSHVGHTQSADRGFEPDRSHGPFCPTHRNLLTGEPYAGKPPVRFGGRGDRTQSVLPTPILHAAPGDLARLFRSHSCCTK